MSEAAEKAARDIYETCPKPLALWMHSELVSYGARCYLRGVKEALPEFKGKEVFDPSIAKRECTKAQGISALPDEGERDGGNSRRTNGE